MRPAGRAALLTHLLGVLSFGNIVLGSEYGVPVEIKLWDTGRTPLSHMVDVTNEFGLKVLAEHNFLNENNIAFSPYGLMGILVALYEGVDGESSYQIQKGMQLPWNRNVMRIGFRDIHRTLKTYFVPEEGFLAGLALNNENVTFNESYKKILRFYGFDLENDQLPTTPANNDTNVSSTPTDGDGAAVGAATTAAPASATTAAPSTLAREDLSTSAVETTTNPNAETISDVDIRMPTSSPTTGNSAAPNAESTTLFSTSQTETTTSATTADSSSTASTNVDTTNTELVTENTMINSTTSTAAIANSVDIEVTTVPSSSSTSVSATFTTNEELEKPSIVSGQLLTSVAVDSTTTTQVHESETTEQLNTGAFDTTETIRTTENGESTVETLERRKKSIANFIFTNPPYIHENVIYRGFDIPIPVQNNPNLGNDQMFLANGLKSVQVSYMQYDAVLEHAYLPHLEAAALRLPLDSERYYLLALLPARAHPAELARLLTRLARHSDLRDVYAALRPRQVRATLPSFTVKGHVTLTADLQKLGIRDVFEPRQRDFTPMTPQAGVYVRSIEQAVSVAIRKYGTDDRNISRYVNRPPVHFSATYPFLYFVMDASIHVALMAGKMVDPLNSRIL
ncbi:transmembrane channel-like protein [Cydia splendana]|uniref:transmembrane channel-like protein n=1 Tax=Cydia splendana TaxID=1100963 RepID=UPI00300C3DA8